MVDYIRGREKGVVHRILTVQPRTPGVEQDPVFEMWSRNRDAKMSLQDMRLLSASVFLLEKGEAGSVPTYEVRTLREALRSEHWDSHWRPACEAELEGLAKRGVWESVHRSEVPKGTSIVPSKLVFKIKVDPDNNFIKCKARLVYRGDLARFEQEYWSTSPSMMSALSFKTMLSLYTSEWGLAVEKE